MTVDLSYLLYWADDSIPVDANMTLGKHLDNDLIVPGEDVFDFHVRIEVTDRGPSVIPLGAATINVNGKEIDQARQLVLGDVVGIGQATMQIGIEIERESESTSWTLEASNGNAVHKLRGEVSVGRSENADLILRDEHISRHHARLLEKNGYVWLQDLGSANGCQVNGRRLSGGVRLFHGDYVRFDTLEFQLIGQGEELTPITKFQNPLKPTTQSPPQYYHDTTEFVPIDDIEAANTPGTDLHQAGAFLLGASQAVEDCVYQLPVGESSIGRGAHNQIVISDTTVSTSHARITVRPEGVTITNLLSTNGTKVNGGDITSTQLHDGDLLRLGRVTLVFKDIPAASISAHPILRKLRLTILLGTFCATVALAWLTLF